jgi:hypothetical protein
MTADQAMNADPAECRCDCSTCAREHTIFPDLVNCAKMYIR